MKNRISLLAIFMVLLTASVLRYYYFVEVSERFKVFNHLTYDAFGYYMYLPSGLIYGDMTSANWVEPMHQQYGVKGGEQLYQTILQPNGKHVFKYLGGVALLQLPFFIIGHGAAQAIGAPADGFSMPYQWAMVAASFFYAFLGLFLLRRFLLFYYTDTTTAVVLLLVTLASNWIQYLSIDGAQSHIFIFPLYALILLLSKKWHENPRPLTAWAVGWTIGMATICRPTEAIMLFIPLLWATHTPLAARAKWEMTGAHMSHLWWAIGGGIVGILPQLIYWKYASGNWIFDVGSKWYFLNPWFRVLFGFEKGWFIYTPVAIFFVLGFWWLKGLPFRRSVVVFALLNCWIIMAWADWRYGGSYSCRALVQSYPVFALGLAAFVEHIRGTRYRWIGLLAGVYLLLVNLFQIYQYNAGIIRYDENSFEHYRSIYLNPYAQPQAR